MMSGTADNSKEKWRSLELKLKARGRGMGRQPPSQIQKRRIRFRNLLLEIDMESLGWVRHSYFGAIMAVKPPPGAMEIGSDVPGLTVLTSTRMALGSSSFMEPST